ncbi:MAG: AsmA-like C-terminal domain-containing protein [Pseudomonadota bacterium]|nr:AsmA-like C-terminal domain-containing protein [Pseudomonadota bacterium]
MHPATKKRIVPIIGALVALAVVAVVFLGLQVFRQVRGLEAHRPTIEAFARQALGRDLCYESARLSFRPGPSFTFAGVEIAEKDRPEPFATAREIAFGIAVWPYILEKRLVIREIRLDAPRVRIVLDREGRWNIADLFAADHDPTLTVGGITVTGGEIAFVDAPRQEDGPVFTGVNFHLERWERGVVTAFSLAGTLAGKDGGGSLSLSGKARLAKKTEDLRESVLIGAKLRTDKLALAGPWPWLRRWVPFRRLDGLLTARLALAGAREDFTVSGALEITGLELAYPAVFPETLKVAGLRLTGDWRRGDDAVVLSRAEAVLDDLKVRGGMTIQGLRSPDPLVEVTAAVTAFDLERHGQWIPHGIVPAATGDFVRKHIRAGVFHVETGVLKGRISEMKTWGAANRTSILMVRAKATKGRLDFGEKTPALRGIAGELVMTERELILQDMSGYFGAAPFSLSGRIENYALSAPATYPFAAVIQPTPRELAWLFGNEAVGKTSFAGPTTLKLLGRGPAAAYEVTGDWELGPARYGYGDWFAKPVGRANSAHFQVKITARGMAVAPCRFSLPPLEIEAEAFYPFAGAPRSAWFAARSNRVTLSELKPLSPFLTRYEAAGSAQGQIRFEGKNVKSPGGPWQGVISLREGAFKPSGHLRRVRDLAGVIQWEGDVLTASRLAGRYGQTAFTLSGTRKGSPRPVYRGAVAIPAPRREDLGAGSLPAILPIRDLQARVAYEQDALSIADLTFRLGEGSVAAAGETRFAAAGPVRHRYRVRFEGVAVADLFREGDKGRPITGTASGRGELTAAGGNEEELLRSLAGNLGLRLERGTIDRFPALAKILSLLNVSQLLRGRLPDLTAEGMPYRSIAATLAIENGVVSTKDFHLDSDAMNMAGTGKADLVRRVIDAVVGIQPLQTVDKAISRIPIAGWILADDDRRFLTVYFEAKGPLDDPAVRIVPLRGLSEETFNLFKRVLKLPKRLIDETGELVR